MGSKKRAEKPTKKGREKVKPVDGLGPYEKKKLRNAIRQIWHRSKARKLCVDRSKDKDGFDVCENCGKRNPKNKIDHKVAVGEVDGGFIERMFVSSKGLQAWCDECHKVKTKKDNARLKRAKKEDLNFY